MKLFVPILAITLTFVPACFSQPMQDMTAIRSAIPATERAKRATEGVIGSLRAQLKDGSSDRAELEKRIAQELVNLKMYEDRLSGLRKKLTDAGQ